MKLQMARICGFAVAIIFIIMGSLRGEVSTVFNKAVNICLECIGIG